MHRHAGRRPPLPARLVHPHDIGRKAIAQNAADIEAMGGRATAFVVGFGAPGDTPTAQAVELADGLWHEAGLLGAGIVGGDMVAAPQWVVSVTALGDLGGLEPVRRSGAKPGDTVAVIGDSVARQPDIRCGTTGSSGFDGLCRRHLVPEPPYGQGVVAARAGATSMTDVSDGLLADIGHIASASGCASTCPPPACAPTSMRWPTRPPRPGRCLALGARGRGRPCAGRDVPGRPPPGWRSIGTVSAPGRTAPGDGGRRRVGRQPGLAVVLSDAARYVGQLVTARPLSELVDEAGPAHSHRSNPRSPQMGEFLRAETGRRPAVPASRSERVARVQFSF